MRVKVLFVCLGNICRSPTAEAVFTQFVKEAQLSESFTIDSAGTIDYHVGEHPDTRAIEKALEYGYEMHHLIARQICQQDFEVFDYIVAMDFNNQKKLLSLCPTQYKHKISLLLDYAEAVDTQEVPDPYYSSEKGFDTVLKLIEQGARGLLDAILKR